MEVSFSCLDRYWVLISGDRIYLFLKDGKQLVVLRPPTPTPPLVVELLNPVEFIVLVFKTEVPIRFLLVFSAVWKPN